MMATTSLHRDNTSPRLANTPSAFGLRRRTVLSLYYLTDTSDRQDRA
jgi:hypothetical protein